MFEAGRSGAATGFGDGGFGGTFVVAQIDEGGLDVRFDAAPGQVSLHNPNQELNLHSAFTASAVSRAMASGVAFVPAASNAYTLSCSVATYTTSCAP